MKSDVMSIDEFANVMGAEIEPWQKEVLDRFIGRNRDYKICFMQPGRNVGKLAYYSCLATMYANEARHERERAEAAIKLLTEVAFPLHAAKQIAVNNRIDGLDQNPLGWRDLVTCAYDKVDRLMQQIRMKK